MQTFATLVAAAALFQHALAMKMTSVTDHGTNSKDTQYIQLPGLNDVFTKLETTHDSLMSKIESVKSKLSVEMNKSQSLLVAKHSALDTQLLVEQKKTEQLEKENLELEEAINETVQSNEERRQNITALNATNQQLRKQLAAVKKQIDEDDQSLVSSLDDGSDARLAAILEGSSANETNSDEQKSSTQTNSDSESEDDADDNKPLSFLALSRQLRGSKDGDSEAVTSLEDPSEAPEDDADAKKAATPAAQEDPIANLLSEGVQELDDETKQEADKIQKNFDTQMELCKKKTQEQVDKKASLEATLKTTTDYGLQLQAADKELKTAQASLLSMVANQSAFFSRAAQKLEQLENAQSDDRAAELKKPTESKSMDSKATKSTDCTGSDCGPKGDEDDLKSEIKQKPVALPVEAAPSKVEVDQKSAAKVEVDQKWLLPSAPSKVEVDQKSAAKVEVDQKSTDCTGSDCGPKGDEDDLKSEIKQKPVALPVEAAPSKVEVDQKSAAKVDQKSAAKVELDPKSVQAIVAMGFAPADAKQALRQYGGSVVAASAVLNASVVPH